MGRMKKSVFYSLDAAVAMVFLVGFILASSYMSFRTVPHQTIDLKSDDIIQTFSVLKIGEANYSVIKDLIDNGSISERQKDLSIVEYVGELWSHNKTSRANLIIDELSGQLIDDNLKLKFLFDNDTVYERDSNIVNFSSSKSSAIVTGITRNKTVKGVAARTYLTGIANKITSSYVFFGGFVGQGNITKIADKIPSDSEIIDLFFESYYGSDMSVYINGNLCSVNEFSDTGLNSTFLNLSSCIPFVLKGLDNNFTIIFNDTISNAYIGGGFFEIKYRTKTLADSSSRNTTKYTFPGIDGLINIYSSLYVPGELSSMNIFLHYDVNHSDINNASLFLLLGNKTVYEDNSTESEVSVNIDNLNLSSQLTYSDFDDRTVPVKLGFNQLSYTVEAESGNADVVLITDLSGSMDRCIDNNNACSTGCSGSACRIDLAKALAKDFANSLLNVSGNRLGLVTYSNNAYLAHSLSEDEAGLNSSINAFSTGGATCICCAVRMARMHLQDMSNDSRSKFIIVMTDGIGNIECDNSDINDTNGCGYSWCGGWGGCSCPQYESYCGGCMTYDSTCQDYISNNARTDAVSDSCYARSVTNATLHSIGFGSGAMGCSYAASFLEDIALCGEGQNFSSDSIEGLSSIYSTIADDIVTLTRQAQTIEFSGANITMKLFSDSYINYSYVPSQQEPEYGYIDVVKITDYFGSCSVNISLPDAIYDRAFLTSYSSKYWTDILAVNGQDVFDLSAFGSDYSKLGDPFVINVPSDEIMPADNNSFYLNIGASPGNSSGCSDYSRLIYKLLIPISVSQSGIYDYAEGCAWNIEYDGGDTDVVYVPLGYSGSNSCSYTTSDISYVANDAVAHAFYDLLSELDIESDGDIDVRLDENKFNIETVEVTDIPGLWGPSLFEVKLWQ